MKKENVNQVKMFMKEHNIFDGEDFVKFNVIDTNLDATTITVAVTTQGRISVETFDLLEDDNKDLYFEYGLYGAKVDLDYFAMEA